MLTFNFLNLPKTEMSKPIGFPILFLNLKACTKYFFFWIDLQILFICLVLIKGMSD